jgi:hypothetical protein
LGESPSRAASTALQRDGLASKRSDKHDLFGREDAILRTETVRLALQICQVKVTAQRVDRRGVNSKFPPIVGLWIPKEKLDSI